MWRSIFAIALYIFGCGMPNDPDGTFDRVKGKTLRVGITESEPWTQFTGGDPKGVEAELAVVLAGQMNSRIEWTHGTETRLVELLHQGRLDLMIGGLTESSPWGETVGFTQAYIEATDKQTGKTWKHVWAVPPGENRWLLEVDKFLQGRRMEAARLLEKGKS